MIDKESLSLREESGAKLSRVNFSRRNKLRKCYLRVRKCSSKSCWDFPFFLGLKLATKSTVKSRFSCKGDATNGVVKKEKSDFNRYG